MNGWRARFRDRLLGPDGYSRPFGDNQSKGETTVSPFFWVLFLGGSLLLPACQAELRESKAELAQVSRGIDLLRDAENPQKAARLAALKGIACKHHCQLKQHCVSAYQVHLDGLQKLAEAKRLVFASKENDTHALSLLADAENQLNAARPETQKCAAMENEAQRDLKRK